MNLCLFFEGTGQGVAGKITNVRQPLDAISEAAMQTLVSRIKTPDLPPRTILLDAELVVR